MKLSEIKTSDMPKRKLFQIERAVVREVTDLWCKEKLYFPENFSEDVKIAFKARGIIVDFSGKEKMIKGSPEATVNEMMRGLILTMASDQNTGGLIDNYEDIIGNVLDVFVHRLKEIGERKFIFERLQTLELGFGVTFGLNKEFYPIKKVRHILDDILMDASKSSPEEAAKTLINDIHETESLGQEERGVTFHIITVNKGKEASFISLPLGSAQASYVSLLGTHTLRCNIIGEAKGSDSIKSGILKIDAPSHPLNFIRYKGMSLSLDEKSFMEKLSTGTKLSKSIFTKDELAAIKLLFNEYVQLAYFLLKSGHIDKNLRLLIIFPRINIFKVLNEIKPGIPVDEPQTLGNLASLYNLLFKIRVDSPKREKEGSARIPERLIQEKVYEAIIAFSRNIIRNIYKPVTSVKRNIVYFMQDEYRNPKYLVEAKSRVEEISNYLKKLKRMKTVAIKSDTGELDLETTVNIREKKKRESALVEIAQGIQAAEIEQVKEVIVSKMLDYLSFVSTRIDQIEKVTSPYIKQELIKEIEDYSLKILIQAKAFYKLVTRKTNR